MEIEETSLPSETRTFNSAGPFGTTFLRLELRTSKLTNGGRLSFSPVSNLYSRFELVRYREKRQRSAGEKRSVQQAGKELVEKKTEQLEKYPSPTVDNITKVIEQILKNEGYSILKLGSPSENSEEHGETDRDRTTNERLEKPHIGVLDERNSSVDCLDS
ncbi:hypothetical protein AKJ39_01860 [candidate division MSBL1 archaeon SCGC-AAA259J03]|uniref:Uncharacterized protein n=1 Tax=candidate division MSBL1 archaeon SCGC-AAA259J03 TaxID=1698269 RepID=A0A656YWX0_9EURY|nr:hypothetical protein AKJ39_01860 [candidate division MSBL1 archaeon SCGC-AAA259J03]